MVAAQAGDPLAYRQLLSEVVVWLRRYFARRLPPAMVDDIVQETMIALHEKRHTYDPSRPFGPWLAAIAKYKWIDALRTLQSKPTEPLLAEIPVDGQEEAVAASWSLERLLATLKPAQSEAIRLVKLQGLSVEEAAKSTGQSASLIKVNIHRGLKSLIALLQRRTDAD
jgi:RNA polymerase sigma factor (sigma-70 family)